MESILRRATRAGLKTREVGETTLNRSFLLAAAASFALFAAGCSQIPFFGDDEPEPPSAAVEPAPAPEPQPEPMPEPQPAVVSSVTVAQPQPAAPEVALKPSHPERYTVVRGDTLWDIAAHFLEDPWIWPQIWDVNPQIANPHLIYPGDVISLVFVDGRPRLLVDRPGVPTGEPTVSGAEPTDATGAQTVRLQPRIRVEPLSDAIPAISASAIRQFTVKPRVLTQAELDAAPYIVGNYEGRLISASGNQVYARGVNDTGESLYSIYRPGREFVDPQSGETLGIEVIYVGDAKVISFGDPSRLVITDNNRETLNGDVLLPLDRGRVAHDYIPRSPEIGFEGRVISLFDAISQSAQNQTIAINIGQRDGIEIGDMLAIFSPGGSLVDRRFGKRETVNLPDERSGLIMVVRSFDRVSYGLVMESIRPINVMDLVTNP